MDLYYNTKNILPKLNLYDIILIKRRRKAYGKNEKIQKRGGASLLDRNSKGFTLAEVLITLGIIGVVAAMTIPTLISTYKKKTVETQLLKFYSTMKEAIKLSEIDNGPNTAWKVDTAENFYNNYLRNYLKVADAFEPDDYIDSTDMSAYIVIFQDGTGMQISQLSNVAVHIIFYPDPSLVIQDKDIVIGKDAFTFFFNPSGSDRESDNMCPGSSRLLSKGFDVYYWWPTVEYNNEKGCYESVIPTDQEELRDELMNMETYGCAHEGTYCAALIKMNNWKIPDDYPIKF